ncbi:MAG: GCN5-related N-acetyltransferase [Flavipsychrobacter sp.]|nr:GCN5-related N-acetyltransferase [Flavipsychrobacter sp.]
MALEPPFLYFQNNFFQVRYYLETPRLILRELLSTDDEGIFRLDSDPEVHRYVGQKPIKTIEQARQVIDYIRAQYESNGIGRWAVIEKESNDFIGWAGLKLMKELINDHVDHYDLGYRLIRQYWGRGYATEAARATLQYAWEVMHLPDVYAIANIDNIASNQVLTKVGLKSQNTFEHDGEPHVWYEMNNPYK